MNTAQIKLYDLFRIDLKLSDEKAREFIQAVEETFQSDKGQTATKQDISEVKIEIEKTKSELLKWFVGLFITLVLMILGLYAAILLRK